MKISGGKFLVTGGAGFIGSNLVQSLLDLGAKQVVVFDNFLRGSRENLSGLIEDNRTNFAIEDCDLRNIKSVQKACNGIDGVFHLASLCLGHCQADPRTGHDINVNGTYNLLEACVNSGVERLMFASSSSVYGNAIYSPMDEEHPFENKNFYGATKIAGEAMIKAFYHNYGLNYINYRLMNVYGPKQDYLGVYVAVIIRIIDRITQGLSPIIFGSGKQSFDFIYVDDVCSSLVLGMESDISDENINISSGIKTSVNDLAHIILHLMGSDLEVEYRDQDEATLVVDRLGSVDKARELLGFTASTALKEGLQNLITWKQAQKR